MENIKAVLEALILASEVPLTLDKICLIMDEADKSLIRESLESLIADYTGRQSGICIQEVAGGFQFRTHPDLSAWVKKMKQTKPASLSPAALETLAIVAYRQPIVKAEIESIRGVDVSAPLRGLLDKKLIRIVGRKDVPGKPIIYGTTKKFLEVFNLKDLAELPTLRELKELNEHQDLNEQQELSDNQEMNDQQELSDQQELNDQHELNDQQELIEDKEPT
jgi:segregation and condensation protein B